MVAAGHGATLIPELVLRAGFRDPRVAVRRFRDPEPSRTVALVWRATSPRRRDFEALARLVTTEWQAVGARQQPVDGQAGESEDGDGAGHRQRRSVMQQPDQAGCDRRQRELQRSEQGRCDAGIASVGRHRQGGGVRHDEAETGDIDEDGHEQAEEASRAGRAGGDQDEGGRPWTSCAARMARSWLPGGSRRPLTWAAATKPIAFRPKTQPYCWAEMPWRSMKTNGEPAM